ncbi:MAG: MoaD/ThiS family protein [Candidatus Xenobiia bacterium LiM19]
MKKVTFLFRGHLKDFSHAGEMTLELSDNATVGEVISSLGIPQDEITGFFIDSIMHTDSYVPQNNEKIEILPAIFGG